MIVSMGKKYTLDGEVFIILTVTKPGEYPVAGYRLNGALFHFSIDGRSVCRTIQLVEVSLYADFVIDEPVMVRDNKNNDWRPRFFSGVSTLGKPCIWNHGGTRWSSDGKSTQWNECRRPTAEELAT